ncbi:MAG: hypothetical protein ACI4P4_15295 [Faecousia sp.]
MKTYELIIERHQPPCGGKPPKVVTMQTVSTDDPVAYVRALEKDGELQVTRNPDGEIVVSLDAGVNQVKYSFTEE